MKKLLLIAALAAAPAFAESWAIANQGGGEIIVTDSKCPGYPNLLQAFNYGSSGKSMNGCWYYKEGFVKVVWDDGTTYVYPASKFYKKTGSSGTKL